MRNDRDFDSHVDESVELPHHTELSGAKQGLGKRILWFLLTTFISLILLQVGGDLYRYFKGGLLRERLQVWNWGGVWTADEPHDKNVLYFDDDGPHGELVIDDEAFRFEVTAIDSQAIEAAIQVYCLRNSHFVGTGTIRRNPEHVNWVTATLRKPTGDLSFVFRRPLN
jgi:hypothetical protein